jgi:hypothetical protein
MLTTKGPVVYSTRTMGITLDQAHRPGVTSSPRARSTDPLRARRAQTAVIMVSGARFSWRVQRRVANQAAWAGDVMLAVPVPAGDMCSAGGSNEGFDQHAVRPGGWWSKAMLVLSVSNGSMSSHFLGGGRRHAEHC